jgi:hypothetical protein
VGPIRFVHITFSLPLSSAPSTPEPAADKADTQIVTPGKDSGELVNGQSGIDLARGL